ncbi:MAG: dihydrodipicolinate synthase family protein, partial [Nannocystaceae bacterium]
EMQLKLTEALFAAPNPIPVKAALKIFGLCAAQVRSPLIPLPTDSPLYRRLEALAQEIRHDQ